VNQKTPWKVMGSAGQKMSSLLLNPKTGHCVRKNPPMNPILSQVKPLAILTPCILKVNFNIILPSTPKSPVWFFPSGSPINIVYSLLIFPLIAACPVHIILAILNHHEDSAVNKMYNSWNSSFLNFLQSQVTLFLLDTNILFLTMFSTPWVYLPRWGKGWGIDLTPTENNFVGPVASFHKIRNVDEGAILF
jgi:hypothetical protein